MLVINEKLLQIFLKFWNLFINGEFVPIIIPTKADRWFLFQTPKSDKAASSIAFIRKCLYLHITPKFAFVNGQFVN